MQSRVATILRLTCQAVLATTTLVVFASASSATPPREIADRVKVCTGCHGGNGIAINPLYPNIAGQHEAYLVKALTAYRDGARRDALMTPMASGLTDAEIAALARFYAAMPGCTE